MKKYVATGHYTPQRLVFDTKEEAMETIREWLESDLEEHGHNDPLDYYVIAEEILLYKEV